MGNHSLPHSASTPFIPLTWSSCGHAEQLITSITILWQLHKHNISKILNFLIDPKPENWKKKKKKNWLFHFLAIFGKCNFIPSGPFSYSRSHFVQCMNDSVSLLMRHLPIKLIYNFQRNLQQPGHILWSLYFLQFILLSNLHSDYNSLRCRDSRYSRQWDVLWWKWSFIHTVDINLSLTRNDLAVDLPNKGCNDLAGSNYSWWVDAMWWGKRWRF